MVQQASAQADCIPVTTQGDFSACCSSALSYDVSLPEEQLVPSSSPLSGTRANKMIKTVQPGTSSLTGTLTERYLRMYWTAKEPLSWQETYCSEQLAKPPPLQLVGTKGGRRHKGTGEYLGLSIYRSLVAAVQCYAVCDPLQ